MQKKIVFMVLAGAAALALAGFAFLRTSAPVHYKDGVYEGVYKDESKGDETRAILTVRDHEIAGVELIALDGEGKPKDENYGRGGNEASYRRAQLAVEGFRKYPEMFMKTRNVEEMEAVSGATVTFKEFKIALQEALKKARE